jgi:hypothetical protein
MPKGIGYNEDKVKTKNDITEDATYNDEELADELLKHLTTLEQIRQPWEDNWQVISDLVTPRRGSFKWDANQQGNKYDTKIFDTTAIQAARTMARGLMGTSAPQTAPWFKLVYEKRSLNQDKQAAVWLEKSTRLLNHLFDKSKLYSAMEQLFNDGGAIATSCMWIVPHPSKLQIVFRTRHMKEMYLSTNQYGEVDVIYRRYELQAREALKEFGEDAFEDAWVKTAKESPFQTYKFVHCTYPREDKIAGKIDAINKPIASIHILEEGKKILKKSGYETNPYIPWRFELNPGEDYGTGPAWDVQTTILRINQERKDTLNLAHKIADPPMNVASENVADFRRNFRPKGVLTYKDENRLASPVVLGANYPVTQDIINDDQQEIKDAFMNNFFIAMLARQGRQATATEINELAGEKTSMLSAISSRLNSEFFNPLFDRVWDIAQQNDWLPPLPESMAGKTGAIKVDYIGPLAQAMKRHAATQGIVGSMSNFAPFLEIYPQMADNIDPDELALQLLEGSGMPSSIIKDRSIRDKERQQRAQAQQEAIEAEKLAQTADMIGKTTKAPEGGSGAEAIMNELQQGPA